MQIHRSTTPSPSVRLRAVVCAFITAAAVAPALAAGSTRSAEGLDLYESRIRPLLAEKCYSCHSDRAEKLKANLRLDTPQGWLGGGDSGPAVVPGKPGQSLILQAVEQQQGDLRMPPKEKLAPEQINDLRRWIELGAPAPTEQPAQATNPTRTQSTRPNPAAHWAFQPLAPTVIPPGDGSAIDRLLERERRRHGLKASPPADRAVLLRRVAYDLTGLPPSPEELQRFLNDRSQHAWSNVVDRLLASPRYGERWGRHWMDVVRYADTAGDNADYPVPEAHLYRDYIINAFNEDLPYDRFVMEQLAGDVLAAQGDPTRGAAPVVATGFLALSRRYGTGPFELWHLTLENTIETVGQAFLGLNLKCARCHDHKFDPVSARDYYALYGIFASTRFPWAGSEEIQSKAFNRQQFVPIGIPADTDARMRAWTNELTVLRANIEALTQRKAKEPAATAELDKQIGTLKSRLRTLEKPGAAPGVQLAYAVQEGAPADAPVQLRGDPGTPGTPVPRGAPGSIGRPGELAIAPGASGRRELAAWIVSHPLTARVMVNRIWQHHFGTGLAPTPNNLGLRSEPPTHPELLNFLASELIRSGWSVKAMHRLILNTEAYRQSSAGETEALARDPSNRWLWRFERRRLDAEQLRDSMLAASGELQLAPPGPHPFPGPDKWTWTQHTPFKEIYDTRHRSVYLMTQRFQRHPFLALFDGPDTNSSTEARRSSIVPQQALFLMNDRFVTDRASALADRILDGPGSRRDRVHRLHQQVMGYPPSPRETRRLEHWLREAEAITRETDSGAPAERGAREAWVSLARVLFSSNAFFHVD